MEIAHREGDSGSPGVPIRRVAEWKDLVPQEEWCPEEVAKAFPELREPHCLGLEEQAQAHRRSHYHEQSEEFEGWRIVGATRRGRMHAHDGSYREDSFAFKATSRFAVLCVSDGAGSSKFSRVGSEVTCRHVVGSISEQLQRLGDFEAARAEGETNPIAGVVHSAVLSVCERLRKIADATSLPAKEFRCTLLLALILRTSTGQLICGSQIGDGAICARRTDGQIRFLGDADSGGYSGEVSCFIPDDGALSKARKIAITEAGSVECLLLCSDGVDDPFYPLSEHGSVLFDQLSAGVKDPAPGFEQEPQDRILTGPEPGAELLKWLTFKKRGENDDRTILVMSKKSPAAGETPSSA